MYCHSSDFPKTATLQDKALNWRKTRISDNWEAGVNVGSMASVSRKAEAEAVVFSIQFYGKTIGEVGLMDQDLSQLDWQRFKSYIFQNLLSMNNQENICVSYSDDEGDKLPIESEEEYREALKVAKKKAEAHDKLVLDITRQGGLPTVFSIVSSGIKRASSSPPKEGGMSFFKSASPPKDSVGFMARTSTSERRSFPSFFANDRGGEEMGAGGEALHTETERSCDQPPEWFSTYMNKFRDDLCEEVITKLGNLMREECLGAPKADNKPNNKFSQIEAKKSTLQLRPVSKLVEYPPPSQKEECQNMWVKRGSLRRRYTVVPVEHDGPLRSHRKSGNPQKRGSFHIAIAEDSQEKETTSDTERAFMKKEDTREGCFRLANPPKGNNFQFGFTEQCQIATKNTESDEGSLSKTQEKNTKMITKSTDVGVKRKKSVKEDEKVTSWLEKIEEKMAKKQGKIEERFIKKHEKLDERLVKKQEKLAERFQKQQDKVEKWKPSSRRLQVDVEKNIRAQGKMLAKYEGRMKKQAASVEELSKLRKAVDKHHKGSDRHHDGKVSDQRQLRRSDRKPGCLRPSKSRRIAFRGKAFPVDPSLLHKALLELESPVEDSPDWCHASPTRQYDALYMKDVTYPNNCEVPLEALFTKTWKVHNSGLLPWNEETELREWGQVQFHESPMNQKLKPLEKRVVCPPLKPGESGQISISFIAPSVPGWYAAHWRFFQQGVAFGNQIWCSVYVGLNDTNQETQAACGGDEANSKEDEASPPEDKEKKECPETATSAEQSSLPQETLIFKDAAQDISKADDNMAKSSIVSTSDDIPESGIEPPVSKEEEQQQQSSEYEVGIIENYYDAEDSAEEDTQLVDGGGQDNTGKSGAIVKVSADLISFEEEAELVPCRSSSPDAASQVHFVVPLKDIAKESVDSLRDLMKDSAADKDKQPCDVSSAGAYGLDDLSFSSESFSDLDSDDQAILNESDTDTSDQEYCVVTMPECFDLTHPYLGTLSVTSQDALQDAACYQEPERHDSPDFLTADEDDRTTTAAVYNYMKYYDESATSNTSGMEDDEGNSLTGTITEVAQSSESENEKPASTQDTKPKESNKASLPLPPTDTKGFMDIPPEALRTNAVIGLYKEAIPRPEAEQQQQQQEPGRANWSSGREERQEVVCEQPVSAQAKTGASTQSQSKSSSCGCVAGDGSGQGTPQAGGTHHHPSGDEAAALPDELVSIIPEDLVRGVWNTARTFITRINQEMLSPSANGPERIGEHEDNVRVATPPHPTQEPPHQDEGNEAPTTPTPEVAEEASLPPPLQQLADMGFTNHEVNQCLLTKYNNDVACAVAELIVLNCQ